VWREERGLAGQLRPFCKLHDPGQYLNVPTPHPDADPDAAAQSNIRRYRDWEEQRQLEYQRGLAKWEALTPEEQQITAKPTPPVPIA